MKKALSGISEKARFSRLEAASGFEPENNGFADRIKPFLQFAPVC